MACLQLGLDNTTYEQCRKGLDEINGRRQAIVKECAKWVRGVQRSRSRGVASSIEF